MKIVVIGAVAAGMSAAAQARRNAPSAQITVYERGADISYVNCTLPYYISGMIADKAEIVPRDAEFFRRKYGIEVKTRHEAVGIDRVKKTVSVKDLKSGSVFEDAYDKLVIATGASAFIPDIPGARQGHVFTLRGVDDAEAIRGFIDGNKPKSAVIIGSGSIGLEMLESLPGMYVTLVEAAGQIAPALDADMASALADMLREKGASIFTSRRVERISQSGVTLNGGETLDADMVIIAAGVRPDSALAQSAGLELGVMGAIRTDKSMRTSYENIYACGDCAEMYSMITGKPAYYPLGSTANKTGRVAGSAATGGDLVYGGSLGTGIFSTMGISAGHTGLTERETAALGYDVVVVRHKKEDRFGIFGGSEMDIKAVADRKTRALLGAQIIGYSGVDKRIDVFAAMITKRAAADELEDLDLCYAPPFSTARDPVHYTGMLLRAALDK